MEIGILGPLEVTLDGRRLALGGAKQRALLAILVLQANRAVSGERITELLWGDNPPATAAHAIEVYVSQLRRLLEPGGAPYKVLLTSPAGYTLRCEPDSLDADRFQALVEGAAHLVPEKRVDQLKQALAMWRGTALAEFAGQPFAIGEAARLNDLRMQATEERIEAELLLGGHSAVIGELVALTNEHPLRERLRGQLMLALYRSGRQAEASDVYQRTRDRLIDELGMEPGPELQALLRRILQHDSALGLAAEVHARTNLPAQLTSFVGREQNLVEIDQALRGCRLVTLVGVGGCGKTRLAVQAVDGFADRFAGGAWFVDLTPLANAEMIPQALAASLGVREQPGRSLLETVVAYLRNKVALLLIDNCEHLVDGAATSVETLLANCRDLRVLATSRERLRIVGEFVYHVPPLAVPHPEAHVTASNIADCESAELFVQRARQSRPLFAINDDDAREIAELCRRLDGIPLAIELAAAQVSAFTAHEILRNLGDRFSILTNGDRARLAKHRTLWATLEWSYYLLDEPEQTVFRRLSVFSGGFDLDAAKAVVAGETITESSIPALVGRLTDKSLLIAEPESSGGTRYRFLETMRQFSFSLLEASSEADLVRERHANHFAELARRLLDRDWEVGQWLTQYTREQDNLRGALAWLRRANPNLGLEVAGWLVRFWEASGRIKEGASWLQDMLSLEGVTDKQLIATAQFRAGTLAFLDDDFATASKLMASSIELKRELGDMAGVARRLAVLSQVAVSQGDTARAQKLAEESLELLSGQGNETAQAWARMYLAWIAFYSGDLARAERLFTDAVAPLRAARDYRGLGFTVSGLLAIETDRGNFKAARQWASQVIELADTHRVYHQPGWLAILVFLAEAEGRYEAAVRLWGAAVKVEGEGRYMYNVLRRRGQQVAERLKSQLGEDRYEALLREGAAMSQPELFAEALAAA